MRTEVMSESEEGKAIAAMMNDGKIITAGVYASLYKKVISQLETPTDASGAPAATFLLDGFPRSAENAKLFEEQVGALSSAIVLSVSDAVAHARTLRLDGSLDEEQFAKRLASHAKRTMPMVDQLEQGGLKVHRVDASGTDAEVFAALVSILGWQLPAQHELLFAPTNAEQPQPSAEPQPPAEPPAAAEPLLSLIHI